jgi:hypothetical protein
MWCVIGLLHRVPPPPRDYWLKVIRHKPEIVDLLLDCGCQPRYPWYPETEIQAVACEALTNIATHPGVEITESDHEDIKASLEIIRILTSRPNWWSKLVNIWKTMETEKAKDVMRHALTLLEMFTVTYHFIRLLGRVERDYYAQIPPDPEACAQVFKHRGIEIRSNSLSLPSSSSNQKGRSESQFSASLRT